MIHTYTDQGITGPTNFKKNSTQYLSQFNQDRKSLMKSNKVMVEYSQKNTHLPVTEDCGELVENMHS
jgi:putative IMPACT (imprinted ancient) family translation regulator